MWKRVYALIKSSHIKVKDELLSWNENLSNGSVPQQIVDHYNDLGGLDVLFEKYADAMPHIYFSDVDSKLTAETKTVYTTRKGLPVPHGIRQLHYPDLIGEKCVINGKNHGLVRIVRNYTYELQIW